MIAMCEPGTCEDCCSTDEWIAPADLRRPPTASVEAPVSDAEPEPVHGLDGDDVDNLLAHVDHLTAENARLQAGIEALHRPVHPVFSWNSGLRFDEPCPECNGKAGVHSCGCWSDEDAEFVCFECSRPSSGYLRRDIPWPCATAALINPPTEGSIS